MDEEGEGNMLPLLIEWANGEESGYRLIDAAMWGLNLSSNREDVFGGLSALAREMLSRMIAPSGSLPDPIYWRQTVSVDLLRQNNGYFTFDAIPSIEGQNPMSGWDQFCRLPPQTIRGAFQVFDTLLSGRRGAMDARLLRICGVDGCGRFFVSPRGGARESRACSKAHQAVLLSRELRASTAYREREKKRNALRMAAVRKAEILVRGWKEEGRTQKERESLLRAWNEKNGEVIKKRAFYNILEKEV